MKIRTITSHDCYNFGASLQAYALQTHLELLGYDVEIIHYKPDYLSGHYNLWKVSNPVFDKPFIKQLYLLAKLPSRLLALKRKKVFDEFTAKYLHLTRRYNSYEELKAEAPEADVYIAGSDQIWNTLFRRGREAAFYLDFGKPEVKRISYAASFATPDVVSEYREFVKEKLKGIDHISIREKTSLPLLASLGRLDGVAVCDPVFLLSKVQWHKTIEDVKGYNEKYILVYLTDQSHEIEQISREMAKAQGWKIYVVGAFKTSYANRNFVNAGPLEFVKLIENAQFVISNSFHGSAFALIFEKNFCVVNRKEGINERMKSMLADMGIENRLVCKYNASLLSPIDYSIVNNKKTLFISESKQWLHSHL